MNNHSKILQFAIGSIGVLAMTLMSVVLVKDWYDNGDFERNLTHLNQIVSFKEAADYVMQMTEKCGEYYVHM